MKSRFARRLTSYAKEHKKFKIPLFIVLVFYLIFHNIGLFLDTHKKQFAAALAVMVIFLGSVSFAPTAIAAKEEQEEEESKVYYFTDDGVVEVDELYEENTAATADDIERLLKRDEAFSAVGTKVSTASDTADTVVYGDDGELLRASFEDDWSLILINKKHHIPDDYDFELSTIKGAIKSDVRVTRHVLDMIRGAEEDGVKLYICSPYRDMEKQEKLFDKKVKSYLRKGYEFEEAYDLASQTVAIPGTSEHQVGLAFDFITEGYTILEAGFAETEAGQWLKENAADYGFILRYPADKEAITEIEFEPWHYRYVGEKAAHEIMDRGLSLEEYVSEIGLVNN